MNLLSIFAKLSLDSSNYDKGISDAEKKGNKLGKTLSSVGKGIKNTGKVITASIGAASAVVVKLLQSSVEAYSNYEQLTGGVETLFGTSAKSLEEYQKQIGINEKSSQKEINKSVEKYKQLTEAQETVMKNAHQAFQTAGMDVNTYMETVTGFSASLIQGLKGNTKEAAEVANRAIIDMSDNANKMGTSIESIQNAYQGFAKQNYTMLDNLKLGYGGTKSEMERLIKDASKLTDVQKELGITVDANSLSFDNIVNAISVMQKEMGIAGTTAEEAGKTIQGSINMMKASWMNLQVAITDPNGDLDKAINDFVSSAGTAAKNLIPAISNGIKGVGQVIKDIAPVLSAELPGLVSDLLPGLISAAVELVGGLTKAIIDNAHLIIDGFGQILQKIGEVLENSDNPVLQAAGKLMTFLGDLFRDPMRTLEKAWDTVWTGITTLATNIWEGIKATASTVWEAIKGFWEENIAEPVRQAWDAVSKVFSDIWEAIKKIASDVWDAIKGFWEENIAGPVSTAWEAVTKALSDAWSWIESLANTVWSAIKNFWEENIEGPVRTAWNAVSEAFSSIWETIKTTASDVWEAIKGFWSENISEPLGAVWDAVKEYVSSVWNSISETANQVWNDIVAFVEDPITAVSEFLSTTWDAISQTVTDVWNAISETASSVWESIQSFIQDPIDAVSSFLSDTWEAISSTASDVWDAISSTASSVWEAISNFISDPINAVSGVLSDIWQGIQDAAVAAWEAIESVIGPVVQPVIDIINGVVRVVQDVIDWFGRLMGYNGETLSETKSSHTHTTYEQTIKLPAQNAAKPLADAGGLNNPKVQDTAKDNLKTGFSLLFGHAKGDWDVPYDNYPALLHRNEMVLTASQARRYRDGETGVDLSGLGTVIVEAIREGMANAQVNSYLDGRKVTEEVNRITGNSLMARRYAP